MVGKALNRYLCPVIHCGQKAQQQIPDTRPNSTAIQILIMRGRWAKRVPPGRVVTWEVK